VLAWAIATITFALVGVALDAADEDDAAEGAYDAAYLSSGVTVGIALWSIALLTIFILIRFRRAKLLGPNSWGRLFGVQIVGVGSIQVHRPDARPPNNYWHCQFSVAGLPKWQQPRVPLIKCVDLLYDFLHLISK
jgi:hypothetical protein